MAASCLRSGFGLALAVLLAGFPVPARAADEEVRGREVRRLRGEILRLEEEKRDLERRLAFVQRELEQTRAKLPRGISTS